MNAGQGEVNKEGQQGAIGNQSLIHPWNTLGNDEYKELVAKFYKTKKKIHEFEDENCKLLEVNNDLEAKCLSLEKEKEHMRGVMQENKSLVQKNLVLEEENEICKERSESQKRKIEGLSETKEKLLKRLEEIQSQLKKTELECNSKRAIEDSISWQSALVEQAQNEIEALKRQNEELSDMVIERENLEEMVTVLRDEKSKLIVEKEDLEMIMKAEQLKLMKLEQLLETKVTLEEEISLGSELSQVDHSMENILKVGKRKRSLSLNSFGMILAKTAMHFEAKKKDIINILEDTLVSHGIRKKSIRYNSLMLYMEQELALFIHKIESLENAKKRLEREVAMKKKEFNFLSQRLQLTDGTQDNGLGSELSLNNETLANIALRVKMQISSQKQESANQQEPDEALKGHITKAIKNSDVPQKQDSILRILNDVYAIVKSIKEEEKEMKGIVHGFQSTIEKVFDEIIDIRCLTTQIQSEFKSTYKQTVTQAQTRSSGTYSKWKVQEEIYREEETPSEEEVDAHKWKKRYQKVNETLLYVERERDSYKQLSFDLQITLDFLQKEWDGLQLQREDTRARKKEYEIQLFCAHHKKGNQSKALEIEHVRYQNTLKKTLKNSPSTKYHNSKQVSYSLSEKTLRQCLGTSSLPLEKSHHSLNRSESENAPHKRTSVREVSQSLSSHGNSIIVRITMHILTFFSFVRGAVGTQCMPNVFSIATDTEVLKPHSLLDCTTDNDASI
eukprot:Nk52_evm27s2356 gene=Nk52_evmTU27s2356